MKRVVFIVLFVILVSCNVQERARLPPAPGSPGVQSGPVGHATSAGASWAGWAAEAQGVSIASSAGVNNGVPIVSSGSTINVAYSASSSGSFIVWSDVYALNTKYLDGLFDVDTADSNSV